MNRRGFLTALALSPLAPKIKWLAENLPAPVAKFTGMSPLSRLMAITLRNRSAQIAENITSHNALLARLNDLPLKTTKTNVADWHDGYITYELEDES